MNPAAELITSISSNRITTGVLITDHLWPRLIEICKLAGLDYAIIDCEHGPHDDTTIAQALPGRPAAELPRADPSDLLRLRPGAPRDRPSPCGLMLPSVDDTAQLDMVRDAVLLPPRGRRRPGGWGNHWLNNYQYETWKTQFEEHLVILPQIETRQGLANVHAITEHEIVTAIAVGPYDLSAELGCCWQPRTRGSRMRCGISAPLAAPLARTCG